MSKILILCYCPLCHSIADATPLLINYSNYIPSITKKKNFIKHALLLNLFIVYQFENCDKCNKLDKRKNTTYTRDTHT